MTKRAKKNIGTAIAITATIGVMGLVLWLIFRKKEGSGDRLLPIPTSDGKMTFGSQGDNVLQMQKLLSQKYNYDIEVDGIWGENTQNAVDLALANIPIADRTAFTLAQLMTWNSQNIILYHLSLPIYSAPVIEPNIEIADANQLPTS